MYKLGICDSQYYDKELKQIKVGFSQNWFSG